MERYIRFSSRTMWSGIRFSYYRADMTHNSSCGCTDVITGIGRTILLVRLYVIESEIRMVDMPSCSLSSRETSRAENPNCFAADFTPASILAGGEGIVRFFITTAGNYERTRVLLSYDLSISDSAINIKISMRLSDMLVRVCWRAEVIVSTTYS